MLFSLRIKNKSERIVGLEQGVVVSYRSLQGCCCTVVLTQAVERNSKISMGDGIRGKEGNGFLKFVATTRVVVLVHVDDALIVVPTRSRGDLCFRYCGLVFRRSAGGTEYGK